MACASIPVYPDFDERIQAAALMAVAATPMYRTFDALVGRGEDLDAHSFAAQAKLEAKLAISARALGFVQRGERMMWHARIADHQLSSTHEAWLWLDSERWLVMEVVPERRKYSPSDHDLLACQGGIVLGGLGRDVRGLPGWCYRAPAIWFAELLDEPRFVQVMLDQGVHACQLVATCTR